MTAKDVGIGLTIGSILAVASLMMQADKSHTGTGMAVATVELIIGIVLIVVG